MPCPGLSPNHRVDRSSSFGRGHSWRILIVGLSEAISGSFLAAGPRLQFQVKIRICFDTSVAV